MEQDRTLEIADNGQIQRLEYAELVARHKGNALWGCSVGFRALQIAGHLLSEERLWDRTDLTVISGHPGPGVRDAIEYVTHCVSHKRFRLSDPEMEAQCSGDIKFEWRISNYRETVEVQLRPDFIPAEFFRLLDRLNTNQQKDDDLRSLEELKSNLTNCLWQEPLEFEYRVKKVLVPLILGESTRALHKFG